MRGSLWLLIFLIIPVFYCNGGLAREKDRGPLFYRHSAYDRSGMQLLVGMVDVIGGGIMLGVGGSALSSQGSVPGARHSFDSAKQNLYRVRNSFLNDERLNRMREVQKLLAAIKPFTRDIRACEAQVIGLTEELVTLAGAPTGDGPGQNRTEEQWALEIEAAEDAVNTELLRYRIQSGKAWILFTTGGILVAQVGTRIWLWNYYDADPGLAPNFVLGYEYGAKPVFRLVGVLDDVEGLFTGESTPEPERDQYEQHRRSYGGGLK